MRTSSVHSSSAMLLALTCVGVLALIRVLLATQLDLFGDEAFYWQASQHLAWAYSDLPGATAWLIAAGVWLFGHTELAVRFASLSLGLALPFALFWAGRPLVGRQDAWLAVAALSAVPLLALNGLLALPDGILLLLSVLALGSLARAVAGRHIAWVLLGVVLALAFATHYRAVVTAACVALAVLLSADGRRTLITPWPWLCAAIALLGLAPIVWFNLAHELAGLSFQMVDRHPWSFQSEALSQPLGQAIAATPLVYISLLLAAWTAFQLSRKGDSRAIMLAVFALLPILGFFVLGLWADQDRSNVHWPLQGYLPLLLLLPRVLRRARPWFAAIIMSTGILGSLGFAAYLSALSTSGSYFGWRMPLPDNLIAWSEIAELSEDYLDSSPPDTLLVADNFMLAAQLSFFAGDPKHAYVLDHPRNIKHGRALQYHIWALDQQALMTRMPSPILLVQEEDAVKFRDLPAHYRSLCQTLGSLEPLQQYLAYEGRRSFRLYWSDNENSENHSGCHMPAVVYLDQPRWGESASSLLRVQGWAFGDSVPVNQVEVLIDGTPVALANYGYPRPEVSRLFKGSTDQTHPDVGFLAEVDISQLAPGSHTISVRAQDLWQSQTQAQTVVFQVE